MPKYRITLVAAIALAVLASPCQAAIYKYVDGDGNITFSDQYRPGAVKIADSPDEEPGKSAKTKRRGKSGARATPANFPRVDASTQRKRDDLRKTLLQEERSKEEKNLAAAKAAQTAAAKSPPEAQDKAAENVRLHEKNIELLDAELARIK